MVGQYDNCTLDNADGIEIIADNYNIYDPIVVNEDDGNVSTIKEDTITPANSSISERCVSKISICNAFRLGVKKMTEMNIPKQRDRKKDRVKRTNKFVLHIYEIVGSVENNMDSELDLIHIKILFNPWYRVSYRSALK